MCMASGVGGVDEVEVCVCARCCCCCCCCCCFRRVFNSVYGHNCGNAAVSLWEKLVAGHLGVKTLGDPATPRAVDDEELFVIEGFKKSDENRDDCKIQGARRNMQISK